MIALGALKDKEEINKFFLQSEIEYNENSGCVTAACGEEILGYCLFDFKDSVLTVKYITPESDISLADGILRSTLHVGIERGMIKATYAKTAPKKLFSLLGFIKNKEEKLLDSDKLFESCCNCEKNSCKK